MPELSPAEDSEGDGEGDNEPRHQNANLDQLVLKAGALEHVSAHGFNGGGERQRLDKRLNDGWEACGGEEDAGENPHGKHDEIHEA